MSAPGRGGPSQGRTLQEGGEEEMEEDSENGVDHIVLKATTRNGNMSKPGKAAVPKQNARQASSQASSQTSSQAPPHQGKSKPTAAEKGMIGPNANTAPMCEYTVRNTAKEMKDGVLKLVDRMEKTSSRAIAVNAVYFWDGQKPGPGEELSIIQVSAESCQVELFDLFSYSDKDNNNSKNNSKNNSNTNNNTNTNKTRRAKRGKQAVRESGLLELLESEKVLKVMHDCAAVSAALLQFLGVRLANVFDTQVAYECIHQQAPRVKLNVVLSHYGDGIISGVPGFKLLKIGNSSKEWMERPLSETMWRYAANQVAYLLTASHRMNNELARNNLVQRTLQLSRAANDSLRQSQQKLGEDQHQQTFDSSSALSNEGTDQFSHHQIHEEEKQPMKEPQPGQQTVTHSSLGLWDDLDTFGIWEKHLQELEESGAQVLPDLNPDALSFEQEYEELICLFPEKFQRLIRENINDQDKDQVIEFVLDMQRPLIVKLRDKGDRVLAPNMRAEYEDIAKVYESVPFFGGQDNRGGIPGTLHRISRRCSLNNNNSVIGLTLRVGRSVPSCCDMFLDLITEYPSLLIVSPPGFGKTTIVRELARRYSSFLRKRVEIVDTSNEIGGHDDVPHPGVGYSRRMHVPQRQQQQRIMEEAVENHTPEVLVIDEIGNSDEAKTACDISQRGVKLIATAHANGLLDLVNNPNLGKLVGGTSTAILSANEASNLGSPNKVVVQRTRKPPFDAVIEILPNSKIALHRNLETTIDWILRDAEQADVELRELIPPPSSESSSPSSSSSPARVRTITSPYMSIHASGAGAASQD